VTTWLQSPTEGLSVEEQVKVIRKTENGRRRKPTCLGIWSHKFYDPNDLEKTERKLRVSACEQKRVEKEAISQA
jgi:hypothetical protein